MNAVQRLHRTLRFSSALPSILPAIGLIILASGSFVGCQTDMGLEPSAPSQISTWQYKAHGGSQIMHSLSPAEISGAKGIFPRGTFAATTTIVMEAGESLADDHQYQEMMLNFMPTEYGRGNAVIVRSTEASAAAQKDFYMEIPIPTPDSVSLTHSLKNLVVIYRALDKGAMETGIIPGSMLKIKGNFVSFKAKRFGSYQAVKLLEAAPQFVHTPSDKPVRSLLGTVVIRAPQNALAAAAGKTDSY